MLPHQAEKSYLNLTLIIALCFLAIFCFGKSARAEEATSTIDLIKIRINEIFPDGSHDKEWLEIFNPGDEEIDISNWELVDKSDYSFIIASNTPALAPGSFFVAKNMTKISLNDTGDEIRLFTSGQAEEIDKVEYDGTGNDNTYCYARNDSGIFEWTTICTENATNIITALPPPPTAGGGGGGSTYTTNETTSEKFASKVVESKNSDYQDKILITEILPNPLGIDDAEWIELYNTATDDYFLDNWKIKDNQSEFIIKNTKLPAKSFLLLSKSETKFVLNNGGDSVELFDLDNKSVVRAEYKTVAKENQSYNFCDKKWLWLYPTPGAKNFCPPPNKLPTAFFEPTNENFSVNAEVLLDAYESFDEDGKIIKYTWEFAKVVEEIDSQKQDKIFEGDRPVFKFKFLSGGKQKITLTVLDDIGGEDKFSLEVAVTGAEEKDQGERGNQEIKINKTTAGYFVPVDLEDVRSLEKNSKILIKGIVSVAPGILGADIFYLAGSGIQIYFSQKDFPEILLGDEVQIAGTLASYYNEARIKVASRGDIQVLKNGAAPIPEKIGLDEIGEETEGSLVTVAGEVTEIKPPYFWLDDGAGEIRAYIKKTAPINLDNINLKVGDYLTLTGIISETSSGYRILPRFESDFLIGKTLGTTTVRQNKKSNWPFYVFPGILAIALVIFGILWKNKKDKAASEEEIVKF